jgi:hypothetical protein
MNSLKKTPPIFFPTKSPTSRENWEEYYAPQKERKTLGKYIRTANRIQDKNWGH